MFFLLRVLLVGSIIAGLGYGALWTLGAIVEPEPREIVVPVLMPRPKG
jgi:hypothetical protein